ncbi:MAG: DUF4276 family protein [Methylobacillus sp.]|nr:DUF4276 family protein [Methylobacillus sp.]
MFVIGEDGLCCALGEKLATEIAGCTLAQPVINTNGVTSLKKSISRYLDTTHVCPVLCLADTDGKCAVRLLRSWLPKHASSSFILRFAVTESESWLLADREGLADFFGLSQSLLPRRPDDLADAKRELLDLARRSKKRLIRQEVVSSKDLRKPGEGYNIHLCDFVTRHWQPLRAITNSPSLERAVNRLKQLRESVA